MRTLSLKMRMTVSVAILFLVFLSLGTFWGVTYFKRDLQREITHRQNTIALAVANHIDNILKAHQGALLALARQVPPGILGQPGEAEKFLRKHDRGRHSFHGHLLILAPTGKLVAASSFLLLRNSSEGIFRPPPFFAKPFVVRLLLSLILLTFRRPPEALLFSSRHRCAIPGGI